VEIEDIKRQIRDVFDPLAKNLGLQGPYESTLSHTQLSIAYCNDSIGIELSIDLSDFFIYALLYKPVGDQVPIGYQDRSGCRHKLYLQEALKELSIEFSKETKMLQKLGGNYKNCGEMALALSSFIGKHWESVNAQPGRWFK